MATCSKIYILSIWNTHSCLLLPQLLFLSNQLLRLQRSHAPASRTRDRLPIPLILHVPSCKHALHRRLCRSGYGDDVAIRVSLDLGAYEGRRRFVANGIEEPVNGEVFLFAREDVLDAEILEEVAVALAFCGDCVP